MCIIEIIGGGGEILKYYWFFIEYFVYNIGFVG